jgi:hypothetical protein
MDQHLTEERIKACVSGKQDFTTQELKHLESCTKCQAVQTVIMRALAALSQTEKKK